MQTPFVRPVVPITLSLIAGILFGTYLPGFTLTVLIFLIVALVRLSCCLKRSQPAGASPLFALVLAGYLSMAPWMALNHGSDHLDAYMDDDDWRIRGVVEESSVPQWGRTRAVLSVQSLSRSGETYHVRGRIRLTIMGERNLVPGDRLRFSSKIRPFRNFKNPGGFDYRRYMLFKGIHGSAWVRNEKLRQEDPADSIQAIRLTGKARQQLALLIDSVGDETKELEKSVLKALVVGDRSGIDTDLRQLFNRSGAGHLLAISGLHVGIVATVAFVAFRWFFSLFPFLLWRGWRRQWAAIATLAPVIAYGLLAGMSPSTQRAEIMVCVLMVALFLGRLQDTFNTIFAAALFILMIFPPSLFSISFQLSFAAVLTIVYGFEKLRLEMDGEPSVKERAVRRIKTFLLISVFAVAGTAPLTLFHFNQVSIIGIAANLFLVPLVGFLAVPMGLLSAFLSFLYEPGGAFGFSLCLSVLHLALFLINFFSSLPFAAITTVTPSLLEIFLYYIFGWALFHFRSKRVAGWAMVVILIAVFGDGLYWSYVRFWHRDLAVTAIDVGQGGSTLLELPGGKIVLYDGGGFSDNRIFDMGKQVVAPFLWRKKIATVDIIVLSHPNADHLNGLIYIAKKFTVGELWTNKDVNTTLGYKELMAVCEEENILVRRIDSGFGRCALGQTELTVLHPPAGYFSDRGAIEQSKRNNGSLVVKIKRGKHVFLLTGDIEAPAEYRLVERTGPQLQGAVLFAPHHGSRSSSTPLFLSAVKPELVIISAGEGNRFGFPHKEVMERYRQVGARILSTRRDGAITIRSNGQTLDVRTAVTP